MYELQTIFYKYGWRRLEYARKLLDQGKTDLALSTVTKSQKYLLHAGQEGLDQEVGGQTKLHLVQHLTWYEQEVTALLSNFNDADTAAIQNLLDECRAIKHRLSQSFLE